MRRRDFLRLAAGAAAVAAGGCGSSKPKARSDAAKPGTDTALRIALWSHFIPGYDAWFDQEYTRQWSEKHAVEVVVDHIPYTDLAGRAGIELASRSGHDIFGFITPPPVYEDEVIDHREIVEEVESKLGKMSPLVERNVWEANYMNSAQTRKLFDADYAEYKSLLTELGLIK
jgi:multiple sugar transport system substrate-binding protein